MRTPRPVLGALCATVLATSAPAAADESPHPYFGVSVNRVLWDQFDGDYWDRHLDAVQASGIGLVRSDAFWEAVEPQPPDADGDHDYDWTILDYHSVAMAAHELEWLPILDYSAPWASSVPDDSHAPPTSDADYADYAAAFARRYGRGGELWKSMPTLPYLPVRTYEVWNEPNLTHFWQPAPDPERYADLYIAARAAIKAVDPEARVVIGGLVPYGTDFLKAAYEARPELRDLVDGVAFHPYASTADGVIAHVTGLRKGLEELGEGDVPILVTEVGWQTSGGFPYLPEAERAASLERVSDTLARSDCGIAAFAPYTWSTPESDPGNGEDWYGIYHPDGTPTTTSDAYARSVAAGSSFADSERVRLCHPADPAPPDPPAPASSAAPPPSPPVRADTDDGGRREKIDGSTRSTGRFDPTGRRPRFRAPSLPARQRR